MIRPLFELFEGIQVWMRISCPESIMELFFILNLSKKVEFSSEKKTSRLTTVLRLPFCGILVQKAFITFVTVLFSGQVKLTMASILTLVYRS